MNSTAGLGPVLAIGVGVTLLVMVTLLPALLVIFGRWIFWPKRPGFGSAEPTASGLWAKVGRSIARRPRAIWVGTALVLLVACLGLFRLDTDGLTTDEQYTKEFELGEGPAGCSTAHGLVDTSNPIMIVANADQAQQVADAVSTRPGSAPARHRHPPAGRHRTHHGADQRRRRRPGRLRHGECDPRRGPRGAGGRRAGRRYVGDLPRHPGRLAPRQQGDHPDRAAGRDADPDGAPAGAAVAGDPDPHRGRCPSARRWASRRCCSTAVFPHLFAEGGGSSTPTRRSRSSSSCSWSRWASTTTSS